MGFYKTVCPKNNVKMTRTIHPVGQGAFYSEVFEEEGTNNKCIVVYDCGGDSIKTKKCITQFWSNQLVDARIDILFISHFHGDHINRINELIKDKCVNDIIIPAITPSMFFVDLLYNLSMGNYGSDANNFLLGRVLPALKDEGKDLITVVGKGESDMVEVGESIWEYEAKNCWEQNSDEKIDLFLTEIEDIIGEDFRSNNFLEKGEYDKILNGIIDGDKVDLLASKFKKYFKGNQNKYSLLVHSRKSDNAVIGNEEERVFSNCLYTGDIPISDEVRRIIKSLDVNMIQVPHHGSEHNFNIDIYHRHEIAFISVGDVNPYNHPSKMVVDQIAGYCSGCRIITESSNELKYQFNITAITKNKHLMICRKN